MWTETEFLRVALGTRLSIRTVAACKDVLVDGMSGTEAAARHQLLPPQVSRGLKVLRERQVEFMEAANVLRDSKETLKSTVVQGARNILGEDLVIEDAVPGREYEGPGILKQDGFLVQRVGRIGVIHDLGKLNQVPNVDAFLRIQYPEQGGMAVVSETTPTIDRRVADRRSEPGR